MRILSARLIPICLLSGALLSTTVEAQTPAPAQAPAAAATPMASTSGMADFGARGTTANGDTARYERYRDLGDGLFLETGRFFWEKNRWLVDLRAEHAGRRDQRFTGGFIRPGSLKAWVSWDQIPMLMSNTTRTLFVSTADDVLQIDDALQAQVQANVTNLPGLFAANSRVFDTRSRRHIFESGFEYLATPELALEGNVRRTMREGTIPYGGSFGHSSLVELPAPVLHTINDVEGSAEYAKDRLLLRGGYTGSWFTNEVTQLAFDSPFRATDTTSTPARGRLSLAPGNSYISGNGLASVKLPGRSRATAYVSVGLLKDAGEPLMPQTINTANATAPIARTTVDGEARTSAVNLSFVTRPIRRVDFSVRYKSYDYDNRTPEFALAQRVSYDNAPGAATMSSLGGTTSTAVHTEPFGVTRHTFDADARVGLGTGLTAGVGYTRLAEDRTHRIIEANTDNVLRLTFDAVGYAMFSLRTKYEHGRRRGEATEEGMRELFRIGEQPGIRHFDVASRDRDRFTLLGSFTPATAFSVNASVTAGKDDYIESLFGLRDNRHRVYGVGVDYVPVERVSLNASYTFERYEALSRSRQANPPSGAGVISYETFLILSGQTGHNVQVADASRNWATDALDRAHGVIVGLDIAKIAGKFDLAVNYDFSRARSNYDYITGPVADRTLPEEVIVNTTLPTPQRLPPTFSQLHRGTVDLVYELTSRVGLGLSLWRESYRVEDFTLDTEATPNLARGSVLLMGYLYRPYAATTVWARMFYRW
jgi:MtrB/PioB family decaheme-associated outer membrane protein